MNSLRRLLRRSKAFPLFALLVLVTSVIASSGLQAQSISPQDIDLFRRLQQRSDSGSVTVPSSVDRAREGTFQQQGSGLEGQDQFQPTPDELFMEDDREEPLSRIEADYARRLGADYVTLPVLVDAEADTVETDSQVLEARFESEKVILRQFGYDLFDQLPMSPLGVTGRMPEDYVLGVGDELVVTFHGSTQGTYVTRVDREGRVALPDLGLINAAGQQFGQFRENVRERTKTSLVGTEAYVSVGSLRQIQVYVMGEVERPGVHRMTSLSSVLDALSYAGGVLKSGSLRRIRVKRNGTQTTYDLYEVMRGSADSDFTLYDGDRVIVPVIGKTVAAVGELVRPAIYELNGKAESADRIMQLAGGPLRPAGYFVGLKRFENSGRQSYSVLSHEKLRAGLKSGDILSVQYQEDVVMGTVRLEGHVRTPGERPLKSNPTVQSLVTDAYQLGDEPYLPFAVIQTTDLSTFARHYRSVDLGGILGGKLDYRLRERDRLIVLSTEHIAFLSSPAVRRAIMFGKANDNSCRGLVRLARIVADSGAERFASAVRWAAVGALDESPSETTESPKKEPDDDKSAAGDADSDEDSDKPAFSMSDQCPSIFAENEHLLGFLLENVVSITGAVSKPGIYPVTREGSLGLALSVSGNLTTSADRTRVELTSFRQSRSGLAASHRDYFDLDSIDASTVSVQPRSSILVATVPDDQESGLVVLKGEFVRPGSYTLRKGERLSSVITRAGGLRSNAYPYGAIFTRLSVKEEQTQGLRRSIRDLRTALAGASLKPRNAGLNLEAALNLANSLEGVELPGRFVVEADPAVLTARPDLDLLVEPGDELFIPKRPTFVSLAGALLNPGTVQFNTSAGARDYIRAAGGFHETADKGRVFVVLPNGSAAPAPKGKWSSNKKLPIPPGSTIVVPIESAPFDWLTMTRDISQIFAQLALAAASLSVINN